MPFGLDKEVIKGILNTLKEYKNIEEIRIFGPRAKGTLRQAQILILLYLQKGLISQSSAKCQKN